MGFFCTNQLDNPSNSFCGSIIVAFMFTEQFTNPRFPGWTLCKHISECATTIDREPELGT